MPTGGQLVYDRRVTTRLPDDLVNKVQHEAERRGLTLNAFIREVLRQAVTPTPMTT
jgi:predicted DNA binding CopG/RHH family protein